MRQASILMGVAVLSAMIPAAWAADAGQPNTLTAAQITDGWLLLFDGLTTFGWTVDGEAKIADGAITAAGKAVELKNNTEFGDFELTMQVRGRGLVLVLDGQPTEVAASDGWNDVQVKVTSTEKEHKVELAAKPAPLVVTRPGPSRTVVGLRLPADGGVAVRSIALKPCGGKSLFNGKDLTGWKPVPGKPSKFAVTEKGELNIKNGPGDLQTVGEWADFVLQLDVLSSGEHLNSGVFFRALPGQFWQGYEAQIRNEWKGYEKGKERDKVNEDRTKPVDYGTGAVYNRQAARKVVTNDNEWFTMTVVAGGLHVGVWVNGFQTADYVDKQPPAESARKGSRLGKGCISLQGHDPTTDMSFKNIRLAELPASPAKTDKPAAK